MKSILILLLASLPLAVLTVLAFVELRSIDSIASHTSAIDLDMPTSESDDAQNFADRLARVDLLAADPLPEAKTLSDANRLRQVAEVWPKWTTAHDLVTRYVDLDRSTLDSTLEELEKTADQFASLQKECDESPIEVRGKLVKLITRRIDRLERQIAREEMVREAQGLMAQSRDAFASQRHTECIAHCDQLLKKFATVLDPVIRQKVALLRGRSRFWSDVEQLTRAMKTTNEPSQRHRRLAEFVEKYANRGARTTAELRVLNQYDLEQRKLAAELLTERQNREARLQIEQLKASPPKSFDERFKRIEQIVASYPTNTVRKELGRLVRDWFELALPEKRLTEATGLLEVETTEGSILRGFFKSVKEPDGAVIGYQIFSTHDEMLQPRSAVGTFRREKFKGSPIESVPRKCVQWYNRARKQVLARPFERRQWTDFAKLCDTLDAEMAAYRAKRGASVERLAFAEEGQFARILLGGKTLDRLKTIMGS